jgi:hypothetical protein
LTTFFNSKLFKFTFKDYFPELLGESRELRKVFFETICVKPTDDDWYKKKLHNLLINKEKKLSISELEKEIDTRIFDLYELSETERSIILSISTSTAFADDSTNVMSSVDRE